jgi:hypothetical protein
VRNLIVSGNVVNKAETGIGVSVVQAAPSGPVRVAGNLVSGARRGIVGLEWDRVVSDDLARDAARWPNLTITGNSVG